MSDRPRNRPLPRHEENAARLVLDVTSARETARFKGRANRDVAFAQKVRDWEEKLAPLDELAPDIAPPPYLFEQIRAQTVEPVQSLRVLQRRVRSWQIAFATASVLFLAIVGGGAFLTLPQLINPPLYAVLGTPEDTRRALVIYDPGERSISFRPVSTGNDAERVPELWLVAEEGATPLSLGVLSPDGPDRLIIPEPLAAQTGEGALLVITMEPPGGAPGGVATGPAVAIGALGPLTGVEPL